MMKVLSVSIAVIALAGFMRVPAQLAQPDELSLEGGFQLASATPGLSEAEQNSVVVITTLNCAQPKNARISARVISVSGTDRVEQEVKLRNVAEGRYVLESGELAKVGKGATLLVVDGRYKLQTASLLVGLRPGAAFDGNTPWVGHTTAGLPTQMLHKTARRKDIQRALAKLSG